MVSVGDGSYLVFQENRDTLVVDKFQNGAQGGLRALVRGPGIGIILNYSSGVPAGCFQDVLECLGRGLHRPGGNGLAFREQCAVAVMEISDVFQDPGHIASRGRLAAADAKKLAGQVDEEVFRVFGQGRIDQGGGFWGR